MAVTRDDKVALPQHWWFRWSPILPIVLLHRCRIKKAEPEGALGAASGPAMTVCLAAAGHI